MVLQCLNLAIAYVVRDANYRRLGEFDDFDEGWETTSVTRTHPVDLIHDNHSLAISPTLLSPVGWFVFSAAHAKHRSDRTRLT